MIVFYITLFPFRTARPRLINGAASPLTRSPAVAKIADHTALEILKVGVEFDFRVGVGVESRTVVFQGTSYSLVLTHSLWDVSFTHSAQRHRQTDRQTDRQMERQHYDARSGKKKSSNVAVVGYFCRRMWQHAGSWRKYATIQRSNDG